MGTGAKLLHSLTQPLRTAVAVAASLCAALAFDALRVPLPWMLGPLFATVAARLVGARFRAVPRGREAAQLVIGTALGLYFTAPVLHQVLDSWPFVIATTLFCIVLAIAGTAFVARLARVDGTTALFASIPGGAIEMFNLAERYGGRADLVAAAQSLRVLLIVSVIPPALALLGLHGSEFGVLQHHSVRPELLLPLFAAAALAGWVLATARIPNAWMLGPLTVTMIATAGGLVPTSVPTVVVNAAQLLVGMALGGRIDRDGLARAGRFGAVVCASAVLLVALTVAFAAAWSVTIGPSLPTVVLASAPGGLAEMCLTAQSLGYSVPLVTAAHVSRILVLVLGAGLALRFSQRWLPGGRPHTDPSRLAR